MGDIHVHLAESVLAHHDLVGRKGVQQLIREEHALKGVRQRRFRSGESVPDLSERLTVDRACSGARLY
jgi:hypothetical protein